MALGSLEDMCSKLEFLGLGSCFDGNDVAASATAMTRLLQRLHRARGVLLHLDGANALDFLTDSALPSLRSMGFMNLPAVSLEPFVRLHRPHLSKLHLKIKSEPRLDDMETAVPIFQAVHALPALANLKLIGFAPANWDFLLSLQLSTLTSLCLEECYFSPFDIDKVAKSVRCIDYLQFQPHHFTL